MSDDRLNDLQNEKLKERIVTWLNRAAMAYEQNNIDLSKQALYRRWQCQRELAELEGTEPPEPPKEPDDYFKGLDRGNWKPQSGDPGFGPSGRDPDQPAPVPRRPLPTAGAGEVALPLPEKSEGET
jgi:hypothetical protein